MVRVSWRAAGGKPDQFRLNFACAQSSCVRRRYPLNAHATPEHEQHQRKTRGVTPRVRNLILSPWRRIQIGAVVLACVVVVALLGYRFFGGYDWIGALWMVVVTISTTGHTERSEFTPALQLFTVFVILFGMTAAVYTFGGFFQLVLEGELDRVLGRRRMTREIEQLTDHIIVCGYGRMGEHLVEELRHQSLPVVVVDLDPRAIDEATAAGLLCLMGDATEEVLLETVGIHRASTLVTALPSDADSVFITLTARDMNPALQIIARAEQKNSEKKLRQAGADRIVMPTIVGARQMVRMITRPGTAQLIDLVTRPSFEDIELDEIVLNSNSNWVGSKLGEIEAIDAEQLMVIAVQRDQEPMIFHPSDNQQLNAGDVLMVMGNPQRIRKFREQASQ